MHAHQACRTNSRWNGLPVATSNVCMHEHLFEWPPARPGHQTLRRKKFPRPLSRLHPDNIATKRTIEVGEKAMSIRIAMASYFRIRYKLCTASSIPPEKGGSMLSLQKSPSNPACALPVAAAKKTRERKEAVQKTSDQYLNLSLLGPFVGTGFLCQFSSPSSSILFISVLKTPLG
jgi:hypothetical protein